MIYILKEKNVISLCEKVATRKFDDTRQTSGDRENSNAVTMNKIGEIDRNSDITGDPNSIENTIALQLKPPPPPLQNIIQATSDKLPSAVSSTINLPPSDSSSP